MVDSLFTRRRFARNCTGATALFLSRRIPSQALPSTHHTATLRFGIFSLFQPQRLRLQSDEPLLLFFDEELPVLLQPASDLSIQFSARSRLTLQWAGRSITVSRLRATATSGESAIFSLAVPPPALHGTITRSFSGTLDVSATPRFLQPVVIMQREDALACIVYAESAPDAPAACLAAQAIVSRSFLHAAHTRHTGFDFCDTTHCQFLSEAPSTSSPVRLALQQTQKLCLVANGRPLAAMYSRSCSGRTHTLAELGLPAGAYPYYSVACEYCQRHPERWLRSLPHGDLPLIESGRLAYNRIHGWAALPSISFTQYANGITGHGIGHGLGLCQRGAAAMAKAGLSAQQILTHYYPNTGIETISL